MITTLHRGECGLLGGFGASSHHLLSAVYVCELRQLWGTEKKAGEGKKEKQKAAAAEGCVW